MPRFGLIGECNTYTEVETGDPGEALAEGEILSLEAWQPEGEVRNIVVVTRDGKPLDDSGLTPRLTFDIWIKFEEEAMAEARDLEGARHIVGCCAESAACRKLDPGMWFTPHGYTSPTFNHTSDEKSITRTLGDWGRKHRIPGAPEKGPWYA